MTNYDEDETSWTTLGLVFSIIIATLGYRFFGPDRVPESNKSVKQESESREIPKEEETVEDVPAPVVVQDPIVKIAINEDKEESNSTGSSEFERISNSEANDMPAAEEERAIVEQLEGTKCEPEKEEAAQVLEEEPSITESPESEDSKASMLVNFDSIHADDEELEASKSEEETAPLVSEASVGYSKPVITETACEESQVEDDQRIEERSNSPSIRTEPSDDEDPLEELKSSSPILVSDQDVELSKQEVESSAKVIFEEKNAAQTEAQPVDTTLEQLHESKDEMEETQFISFVDTTLEDVNEKVVEEKKETKTEAGEEDGFIDTEEDIVKTIDIANVDAAIDALMGGSPILPKDETKLNQVAPVELQEDVHEQPIVPIDLNASESAKDSEKEMDESLTGIQEITSIAEESNLNSTLDLLDEKDVSEGNTTLDLLDEKYVSEVCESSERAAHEEVVNDTNAADESLGGVEEISLPELECTVEPTDEIQQGQWADNTILSNAGDGSANLANVADQDAASEKEIQKKQLEEINAMLKEHNMLGDDVKVDDQVKMYTG